MSWHGRWGKKDPYAKPAQLGQRFGIFEVIDITPKPHPHYGLQARVRCIHCGLERLSVIAALRHNAPISHRGCTVVVDRRHRAADLARRKGAAA